jgi:acyl-coenzyme A synthetase/AMP-(fatty) acid ligase
MPRFDHRSLWDLTTVGGLPPQRFLADAAGQVLLADLARQQDDPIALSRFHGQTVLISYDRQLPVVLALLALDGIARRVLLCPPDIAPAHLPALLRQAGVDAIASDGTGPAAHLHNAPPLIDPGLNVNRGGRQQDTEWLLFTSGTTGRPKIVAHTLTSLIGPLDDGLMVASDAVWSTYYDIRRYGGLTILFRALLGGASMVLSHPGEPTPDFLRRAGSCRVTHMSGTPSHWRRALMAPAVKEIEPNYVRLSGEVADQPILNSLGIAFPNADIAHAFASTEAGFAFDVRDRLAGFPITLVGQAGAKAELRIKDGSLRIRSVRTASGYIGADAFLLDEDGFVDTGDMVELRGDRYHFVGRREGVINVGGQKVHPEEVEAVINRHQAVQMSRVRGRSSPITGAIVVADVVIRPDCENSFLTTSNEILAACRVALPPHKVPAMLNQVASLDLAESGKLLRRPT